MANKNFYEDKKVKKQQRIENGRLKEKIEEIRNELNSIIIEKDNITNNEEILKLSEKLDELIAEYLKEQEG